MNFSINSKLLCDDDARFDRLVDGELSPDEYQALLAALDDEPGGWRRCALAFLEAQALGHELSVIRRGELPVAAAKHTVAPLPLRGDAFHWKHWLAMAASLLVALALGIALPDFWKRGEQPGGSVPAVAVDGTHGPEGAPIVLPREVGSARLVLSGPGGQSQAGELPIYEYAGDPRAWLGQQESALPVTLVNELERRGHRIQRQQQYVPVDLEDGRRAVIPVEAIQITPVSRRAY
jgi:hypothetical protein